jgi:hypothetical protein
MIPSALGLQAMGGFFRNPFRCCRPDCVTVKDSTNEEGADDVRKISVNSTPTSSTPIIWTPIIWTPIITTPTIRQKDMGSTTKVLDPVLIEASGELSPNIIPIGALFKV